eukprot:scaffold1149_cov173-Skeletonema_marinoi.AAC.15
MGRKRNQGKARKAAKARAEEEAKEETGDINQTTDGRQQPLAAQMQHLQIEPRRHQEVAQQNAGTAPNFLKK